MAKKILALWISVFVIYLLVAGKGKLQWDTRFESYFNLQAYSWLHGRLDLIIYPRNKFDLSVYNGKVYSYWPPLPTFFVLPFVALFGIGVSDIFYTAFWASTPPILLFLVLQKAKKVKFIPSVSDNVILLLTLFFAFGTVFFYLSVTGSVWFTSQVISMIPFLLSLYFLFRCMEKNFKKNYLISIIFLCLGFWVRNTLILSFPLYIYILLKQRDKHQLLLVGLFIGVILSLNFFLFGYYNYLRFGNFFENGLKLQGFNPRWQQDVKQYGLSNIHYFPYNAYYLFISPLNVQFSFPYIKPDPEGNSIFFTSPLFFILFGIFAIKRLTRKHILLFMFLITSGFIIVPQLFYYGTGWYQFGYRYALDIIPLLILSLAWVIDLFAQKLIWMLIIISIIINTLGVFWMQSATAYLHY